MHHKTKEMGAATMKIIEAEAIAIRIDSIAQEGKSSVIEIFSHFIYNYCTILI